MVWDTRLGSQVKVRCSVTTSWETGMLVLQLMFDLNVLFQNTKSYIKWWLYILWHTNIDHDHVLLIVLQEFGCFEHVYVKSLMESHSHETMNSMKLTGVGNICDQSTRNWQHKTKFMSNGMLKNLKLHFKMLQNISLIVCIKKASKMCYDFSLTKWLEWGS